MDSEKILRGGRVIVTAVVIMGIAEFVSSQSSLARKGIQDRFNDKIKEGKGLYERIRFELGLPINIEYVKGGRDGRGY